jgi:hypothetical protein
MQFKEQRDQLEKISAQLKGQLNKIDAEGSIIKSETMEHMLIKRNQELENSLNE